MHPFHLPEIRSIFDYIVIELIQRSYCRQFWAWKAAKRMQIKIVKTFGETVERDHDNSRPNGSRQMTFGLRSNLKHDYDLEEVTSVGYELTKNLVEKRVAVSSTEGRTWEAREPV